jgi:hypothetical protein
MQGQSCWKAKEQEKKKSKTTELLYVYKTGKEKKNRKKTQLQRRGKPDVTGKLLKNKEQELA